MTRKLLRIGAYTAGITVVVALLLGGLFYVFLRYFYPDPPKAAYGKPASALEAQEQDLDYLGKLSAMDRSFSPEARKAAKARIATLEDARIALPSQMFRVQVMQIMTLADNGHTHVSISSDGNEPSLLPVRVTRFADGFHVLRAQKAFADMLGGRVDSIDGTPIAEVVAKLETLRGGTEAFRRDNAADFMITQDLLYGVGIAHTSNASTWTVTMPDGRMLTHTLPAEKLDPKMPFPNATRYLSPEPLKGMGPNWAAYHPAAGQQPQSLRKFDQVFRRFDVPGSCADYVRIQSIEDEDGQKISPFLEDTENALRAHPPCAIILDLRFNGGGNYMNTYSFAHALPDIVGPKGHIYILTDPETFSAAITTTAFTKDAGGDKVTILGEPVGDRMAFYAEGGRGILPNSKLRVTYETGKHDYAHACTDWHNCFWLNWFYPVRVKSLQPDEPIPMLFADWNAGHDMAYERAVALANAQGK